MTGAPPRHTIMLVVGTRPEAIKMAPVALALAGHPRLRPFLCATGQHRELLADALQAFGLVPDHDLQVMTSGQSLSAVSARVLAGMAPVLEAVQPALVLVHGDTASALSAALAAFHARLPVGHVEAGLRSGDLHNPFPEEANRRLIDQLCDLCFAPTEANAANLRREGIAQDRICVTGNTAVDALFLVGRHGSDAAENTRIDQLLEAAAARQQPLVLVTAHRRENFGAPLASICRAIQTLAIRFPHWLIVYPVHPNPQVQQATADLENLPNVQLLKPLSYPGFVRLMRQAFLILSDSGGLQEEAPSLRKPLLLLRDNTERHEAIAAGAVQLVGTDHDRIVEAATALATDPMRYQAMSQGHNPFGDGKAAQRIVRHLDAGLAPAHPRTASTTVQSGSAA